MKSQRDEAVAAAITPDDLARVSRAKGARVAATAWLKAVAQASLK